jgi:hypothetical protein
MARLQWEHAVDYDSLIFPGELHMESLCEVGFCYSPTFLPERPYAACNQQILLAVFEDQSPSINPLPLGGSGPALFRRSRWPVPYGGRAPESVAEFLCTCL